MAKASLETLVRYCDRVLAIDRVTDYSGAQNGLQAANRGRVGRIAAAVDAALETIERAIEAGADLLVVHHGLFWGSRQPWTGSTYRIFRRLIEGDLAIYSAHLPLDIHRELGNNAGLCAAMGLRGAKPFFWEKDQALGLRVERRMTRDRLVSRLSEATGREPTVLPMGPATCRRIGVVTGGAGGHVKVAADEGVDTFITGEGPHWTYPLAQELGINVLYGGHYATETFGVRSLAEHLAEKFGLSWVYLDAPSGL